ncbi:MAG: hypothetical protein AAFU03_01860 [Bacteroidota bacterium]
MSTTNQNNPVVISAVAYLAFIGLAVAYVLNNPKTELASFHIRQALGIYLLLVVSGFMMVVPVLGWITGSLGFLLGAVLWFVGLVDALGQKQRPVPLLGDYFQEWFRGL